MRNLLRIVLFLVTVCTHAQIPEKWTSYTVERTVNRPIATVWEIFHSIELQDVGSKREYKRLPKIIRTAPVEGDFTKEGHSRKVVFDNDKTLLESIVKMQEPHDFVYELTDIEIQLKMVARKARGWFHFEEIDPNTTKIEWKYGFDHKNFIAKWFIQGYIKSTHQYFMDDAISEIKTIVEKGAAASK